MSALVLDIPNPNQAPDAEVNLLGAAMSGYPDLDDLFALVDRSDFYHPFHGDIWDAIARVHNGGKKPDPISVRMALAASGVKHDPIRLVEIANACPLAAQAPYYAELVADTSGLRRIQTAGVKVQALGASVGSDLDELRERARAVIDEATAGRSRTQARMVADLLDDVIETAEHGQAGMLGTGWPDIDDFIGGLAPGRLIVVGARPGVGKSLMGTNLALHFAGHHKHAVLLASLEMPEREVGQRLLAAHARANLTGLQMGTTDERAWALIAERTQSLREMPIVVDDAPTQTVTHIRRAARNIQRTRDDLALIVVDYLQLVRPSDMKPNRAEQVAEISRGLKLLARESGACVVAMAQVNREGTKTQDGRPRLTDLRESGAIEADADQVLLLHHPDEAIPEIEVLVAKNRHGRKGIAHLRVRGYYAALEPVALDPTKGINR
jgi:replicative DNA helicase